MPIIQRPVKQFGFRTYDADFNAAPLNPTPPPTHLYTIQTLEVDADLDLLYATLNGGLDDTNIAPGANIQGSKLLAASVGVDRLIGNVVSVALANNLAISTVETAVGTLPALTTIGGHVRLEGGPLTLFINATTAGTLNLRWYEDGVLMAGFDTVMGAQNLAGTSTLGPLPVPTVIRQPAAGAHTYMLKAVTTDVGIVVQTAAAGGVGHLFATEFA